ncbi:hypothetical protein L1047_14225 [Synechococcus sp. Nb3U1]|uniref:hypothetical protein n=1 Tax=Synechococcus sp. Nb3U1 TaxID=1914529 RepID=UPI001F26A421|nr:hypothetical protein [Synechococcus sp. Nb3U1]
MLSPEGQEKVANVFLIPSLPTVEAKRPTPGEGFTALTPDWAFVASNIADLVSRFRTEIVEGIIQSRSVKAKGLWIPPNFAPAKWFNENLAIFADPYGRNPPV